MADLINKQDSLNQGREKLNTAIQDSETAKNTANDADQKATTALSNSENTQDQLDTIIIESGTSDAEVLQARTNNRGKTFDILNDRLNSLDIEFKERGVNVKWFGASGSDQSTTGSMTSGTNELTVTNAINFKVGQGILIEGAGVSGADLITEISSISGTTFTLIDNAGTDVVDAVIKHDDTQAIQNAVDSVSIESNNGTSVSTAYPSVLLPIGIYNISSPINLGKHKLIGNETIMLGKSNHDCFYFDAAQRSSVEGFSFQYFDRCISFDTNNVSGSNFKITNCNAWDSSVFVDSRGYADSRSTVLNIEDCFVHWSCDKAVIAYCDMVNIDGCNFQHSTPGESKMDFDSNAMIRDSLLVPFDAQADMRWVDMLPSSDPTRNINFHHVRISGENSGITAVYCKQDGNSGTYNEIGVSFETCQLSCGGGGPNNAGGVVVLADNGSNSITPNTISFINSFKSGSSYPFVKTESGLPVSPVSPIGFNIYIDTRTLGNGLIAGELESQLETYLSSDSRSWQQKADLFGGDYDVNSAYGEIVFVNATSASNINNILNGSKGAKVYLVNSNNNSLATLKHRSGGTGNIWLTGAADKIIQPFETVSLFYIEDNGRWVMG